MTTELRIEVGTSFVLEPGGAHVMLDGVDPAEVLAPVEVTFVFDDGTDAGLDVIVRGRGASTRRHHRCAGVRTGGGETVG